MCTFSIITPVYNNIEYIEKCILNVISQGKHSLEHLIIDGGSSDGTVQIIQKYALQYSHISWVSEKDKGQSDAMNKGIKLAKGEFISFLNVDDYYSLGTLNEVSTIISNNTLLSFIVGNCNVWDAQGFRYDGTSANIQFPIKIAPNSTITIPIEFMAYIDYCRNLKYEEKPDYSYLKSLLLNLFKMKNFNADDEYE